MMKRVLLLFVAVMVCVAGVSLAAKDSEKTSSDWRSSDLGRSFFGEQWSGPSVPQDELEGKVVWVTILKSSSADVKSLKDMASIDQKFRRKGVVMIAIHYFRTDKDKCLDNVKRAGAKFPVYETARIEWKGRDREGVTKTNNRFYLPYSVMYGPDGMIAWEGKCPPAPSKIASYVQMGLKKMPKNSKDDEDSAEADEEDDNFEAIFEDAETDKVKDIATLIKNKKIGAAIAKCEASKSGDSDRASQAKELLGRLNVYAAKKLTHAKEQRNVLPSKAVAKLTEVKKECNGTEFAKEAENLLAEYKKDKEFQADLAKEKTYLPIVKFAADIPEPEQGCDYDEWQKKNGRRMQTLTQKIEAFKEKNPDSMFCKKLDELLASFNEKPAKSEDEDDADKDDDKSKDKNKDKDKTDIDDDAKDKDKGDEKTGDDEEGKIKEKTDEKSSQ